MPAAAVVAHDATALRSTVLSWWGANGRSLNFRRSRDPYSVLVSEVIAQQTQIARVEPAWEAFLARFPTVQTLADAPVAEVLRQWRGLGYNRRALNLQRAARAVVARHGGAFPSSIAALEALPGVGPYTARAVAAIAFGARVGAVDTNVRRVLGRAVLGVEEAVASPTLQALADDLVPDGRAGEWTHALMDLGATICRPRAPHCDVCPLSRMCRFRLAPAVGAETGAGVRVVHRSTRSPARSEGASSRFEDTARWLRGRLLDRACETADGAWFEYSGPLGRHDAAAVESAIAAMSAEGLLELHPTTAGLARLPA